MLKLLIITKITNSWQLCNCVCAKVKSGERADVPKVKLSEQRVEQTLWSIRVLLCWVSLPPSHFLYSLVLHQCRFPSNCVMFEEKKIESGYAYPSLVFYVFLIHNIVILVGWLHVKQWLYLHIYSSTCNCISRKVVMWLLIAEHARPKGGGGTMGATAPPFWIFFFFFFCLRACYRGWWCTEIPLPHVWKIDPNFLRRI